MIASRLTCLRPTGAIGRALALALLALALIAAMGVPGKARAVEPAGPAGPWALNWSDEFNGGLDTSVWTPIWGKGEYDSSRCTSPQNVAVQNGTLHLKVTPWSGTCPGGTSTPKYLSGLVESNPWDRVAGHTGHTVGYGYTEFRVNLPGPSSSSCGSLAGGCIYNLPQFWFFSAEGQQFEGVHELDVMEGLAGQACFHLWHYINAPTKPENPNAGGCQPKTKSYKGWHTFGVDREKGQPLRFYYDGEFVGSLVDWTEGVPLYMLLDNVAPGISGSTNSAPQDVEVDYVRVWEHLVPPDVSTGAATAVGLRQATISGTVDPNKWGTYYQFQYGPTATYGSVTPEWNAGAGDNPVPVSATIGGLAEGTTYHYRLVASNGPQTTYGPDRTFTTLAYPDPGTWAARSPSTDPNAPIYTFFRGTNTHLTEVWWNEIEWQREDLIEPVTAGTSPAVARSPSTNPNAPLWVFYRGTNGHLKVTWWTGAGWINEDRGAEAAMAAGSSPVVTRTPSTDPNAPMAVFYRGANGNLYKTGYDGSKWSTVDLGAIIPEGAGIAPNSNPALAGRSSLDPNAPIYVFYRGTSGKLIKTEWNGSKWSTQNMNEAIAEGTTPTVTRVVSSDPNAPIAVFYRGSGAKLTETWWNGWGWYTEAVKGSSEITGGSPAAVRSPSTDPNAPIHVFYRGTGGKLTDTWWNETTWSTDVKGIELAAGASPVALRPPSTDPNASIITFYRRPGDFLTQTWYNGSQWSNFLFTTGMG